jgi:hypothetical protein
MDMYKMRPSAYLDCYHLLQLLGQPGPLFMDTCHPALSGAWKAGRQAELKPRKAYVQPYSLLVVTISSGICRSGVDESNLWKGDIMFCPSTLAPA